MSSYLSDEIDFSNIVILDAATGAGNFTSKLAKKVHEASGKSRIVSVDIDPDTFQDARQKLGALAKYVEFVEADLTDMPQIESETFDLVVCTATLCALNSRPLKALKGLAEFYRVLKKGGRLIISEEYPLPKATKSEEEVQVKRWQTYKSIAELVEGEHYTEIYPEELEFAASLTGFKDIEWKKFEGTPLTDLEEWKEVMPPMVSKIEDEGLRKAFLASITEIYKRFKEQGGNHPPSYHMKMMK